MGLLSRIKHSINYYRNRSSSSIDTASASGYGGARPYAMSSSYYSNERSYITTVLNRIAVDVANVDFHHITKDNMGNMVDYVPSGLERCLSWQANIDQTGRELIQDLTETLLYKGVAALVFSNWERDVYTDKKDAKSIRVGYIDTWYPEAVKLYVYNKNSGKREYVTVDKKDVAIVSNPFYNVMNKYNSTFDRLQRKLGLMDKYDNDSASGKLNGFIQMPYSLLQGKMKEKGEEHQRAIEESLRNSPHGLAYLDINDKFIPLNRAFEDNMLDQIKYLHDDLLEQLNISSGVLNGTADEKTMLNYQQRTIKPIVKAISEAIRVKFVNFDSNEDIQFYSNPFELVPISQMGDLCDKFGRNEILTPNEMRPKLGFRVSNDPSANELRNRNISQSADRNQNGIPTDDDTTLSADREALKALINNKNTQEV